MKTKKKLCKEDKIYYAVSGGIITLIMLSVLYPVIFINVEGKLEEIPENLGEIGVFRYAVNELEERTLLLKRQQREERILYRLLYVKDNSPQRLQKELAGVGIFQYARLYCAMLIKLVNRENWVIDNSDIRQMFQKEQYELCAGRVELGIELWDACLDARKYQ